MAVSGSLLLDKEEGWTSQDCVSKLRGILGERRIGHAGTLDPLATGLLVVLVGRATRAAAYAEAEQKEYIARFRPGIVTDTQDITGNVLSRSHVLPTEAEVRSALPRFTGEIDQIPPMYSAIKVNGRKLYEIARRGGEVERQPRPVTIYALEHLGTRDGDHILRVECSKGTYIRTLCHDLGQALGCGGCMAALRRTAVGAFRVEDAVKIGAVTRETRERLLLVDTLFRRLPAVTLDAQQERRCRCGNPFPLSGSGEMRLYGADGAFLALGWAENGRCVTVKSFFEVD
jgi:tRNA pseudouridine55 synthase